VSEYLDDLNATKNRKNPRRFERGSSLRTARMMFVFLLVAAFLLPGGPLAQNPETERYVSPWKTPWTYEGANRWSELDPDYAACNVGKEQSPIDIRHAQRAELPALRFEYKTRPLKYVINNGHTIRVNYHEAPGTGNFLIIGDQRYQLTQFHFRRPSEEYIHGKPYDMEVHLMHQASDGKVAGVAIVLKIGSANATIQKIWEHMPKTEGQQDAGGVDLNPAGLLPHTTGYYTYMGSQTAPPCTEGVTWFVLKTLVEISAEQVNAFAKIAKTCGKVRHDTCLLGSWSA
jgi:carbonic anhydrase